MTENIRKENCIDKMETVNIEFMKLIYKHELNINEVGIVCFGTLFACAEIAELKKSDVESFFRLALKMVPDDLKLPTK